MLGTKKIALCALSITINTVCYDTQQAFNHISTTLNKYKDYLDHGTLDHQDWSDFKVQPLSRYYTFRKAFEHFVQHQGKIVVELGTSRSFVHGGLRGCNSNDRSYWTPNQPENWDWGAGFFTRMAAECLAPFGAQIHTIDIEREHINRCKVITYDYRNYIGYHVLSSVEFLSRCTFAQGIDLLYLDTGDMTPIEPTAQLQLEEAKVIVARNLIAPNGIIVIDDVRNQTPKKFGETSGLGKSKYALPYLLAHGFEIIADEYQVILKRK